MLEYFYNPQFAHFFLRVVLGVLLVAHGYPKLFKNFSQFAGWLDTIGLRPGKFWALVAGIVEFFGGILLVLGIWVQLVGILFAIQMVVAMWKLKWGKAPLTGQGGWELELLYGAVALAVAMMGPGMYPF